MADREKVSKGLEECAGNGECTKCQYGKEKQVLSCKKLLVDALELLKEQEAIESINFVDRTEIVRCNDCQFYDEGENEVDAWMMCSLHRINTSPDKFCSWGIKK